MFLPLRLLSVFATIGNYLTLYLSFLTLYSHILVLLLLFGLFRLHSVSVDFGRTMVNEFNFKFSLVGLSFELLITRVLI